MSELAAAIDRYLNELALQNASTHTLRNYRTDLNQLVEYFSPPGTEPPAPNQFTSLMLREWLGDHYDHGLSVVTIRRKLAAVRSLFKFMLREGTVSSNIARVV
jgi:integrase/recombinase XerC